MMRQYETFELRFTGEIPDGNYARINLTAVFSCGSEARAVRGFYDGEGRYVVRFLPEKPGDYRWKVTGAVQAEGRETCLPAGQAHGIVRAVDTHFEYADGSLFIPFGTTVYALASQDDSLVEQTLESLKTSPFNKVRLCVFPKHYDYNHNDPPLYAFEKAADGSWDTSRPCIAFWQRLETILKRISALGIQADLILFHPYDRWGFASLPQQANLEYLDYLLRRLSAFPDIWWSLANEYDLDMNHKSLADWEAVEAFVAAGDPYRHLLSCHNCMCFWDFSRPAVTHASIQTKALTEIPRWIRQFRKPVVVDECCYEGNLPHFWGSISGQEMVRRFWRCYMSGGYCTHGETFLSGDDILWWSRGGVLKGSSPARIAFLRQILESLPGPLEAKTGGLPALAERAETDPDGESDPDSFFRLFAASLRRMDERDKWFQLASEHVWETCCGEEAYLYYFDLQCYGRQVLRLPAGRRYRVEVIDTWNMTRETVCESASGETAVSLPGREGMAVLAVRI